MPFPIIPLVIMSLASAAANAYGASKASKASKEAAGLQVDAANRAAELEYAASQDALDFQKQMWASSQSAMEPYVRAGQGAVSNLSHLLGVSGVSPTNWTAQPYAPTDRSGNLATVSFYPTITGSGSGPMASGRTSGQTMTSPEQSSGAGRAGSDPTNTGRLSDLAPAERKALRSSRGTRTGSGIAIPVTGNAAATTYAARNSDTVKMATGTGQTVDVPAEYQQYFEGLGYKVVSNG